MDNQCVIDIADTGEGIALGDIDKVFDRFYQADPSRHLPGVGLGLSIVRAIVHAHGGQVNVRSQLTKGAIFSVTLPSDA